MLFSFVHSAIAIHMLVNVQLPLEIRESSSGAFDVQAFFLPYSPNFPDPDARRVEALFNTADIKNNPSLARPATVGQVCKDITKQLMHMHEQSKLHHTSVACAKYE